MTRFATAALAALCLLAGGATHLIAHCDTLDGPVVADARAALQRGDVTPALKWVGPGDEQAIRDAFLRTRTARAQGDAAREVADTWFFETLVRIHRAGEGAAYTGLKPAGSVEPPIAAADRALESGTADALTAELSKKAAEGIQERFARALAARGRSARSVAEGRAYVEAYVEFIHYVEALARTAAGEAEGHP
jgi:hypothetical protein